MGARTFEIQVNIEVKSCIVETSRLSTLTLFLNGVKEIAYFIASNLCSLSDLAADFGLINDEDEGHSKETVYLHLNSTKHCRSLVNTKP